MSTHEIELPNYGTHEPSLHEIDPIPEVEPGQSTGSNDRELEDGTLPIANDKKSSYPPLGLTSHSVTWYLTRLQRYSTYAFSAFAAMHITNTSLIPLLTRNVPAAEPYLLLTRPYYQSPLAEPFVIALPLWTHVLSGLALRVHRRNLHAARYGDGTRAASRRITSSSYLPPAVASFLDPKSWPAVSLTSKTGFALTPLVAGHVLLTRGLPLARGQGNVGLEFIAHGFARHPVASAVGFAALVGVGSWHVVWGWARWLGWTPEQVVDMGPKREQWKRRRWAGIHAVAAAVTAVWLAGSFGVVARGGEAPGWLGREYDEMLKMIPGVGTWLARKN